MNHIHDPVARFYLHDELNGDRRKQEPKHAREKRQDRWPQRTSEALRDEQGDANARDRRNDGKQHRPVDPSRERHHR